MPRVAAARSPHLRVADERLAEARMIPLQRLEGQAGLRVLLCAAEVQGSIIFRLDSRRMGRGRAELTELLTAGHAVMKK
jgi:hypothetical protein